MFVGPLEKFWRIFGNLRKVVRNIQKNVVVRILYNIQKIAWSFGVLKTREEKLRLILFSFGGGRGGIPMKGRECSSEILKKIPKAYRPFA